ncbi:hypothetical protein MPD5_0246 [Melissococcus plutonius DAT561]|uniref:Cell division protein DivIC (FtsB), stabilizes FtsL against RasP cleavage n=1 Tax=Melissococcus plutonius TaxID=33970 RepID=A0A2Z5Y0M2_9ENTE|nr:septum formation initiator family protein [Melissococcus plutonius]BAL61551.1 hypothetical protein MPD5_0246 [Melissococcus plutonius DAT561]BBC60415.1 cell division protein DivIC (FtsB), stabilizes FtsL against RasP cleavage [Melissococcus plutonius]
MKKRKDINKIASLTNDYIKEQQVKYEKRQKQLIFKRRRLAVIFTCAFIIFIFSGFQLISDYSRLNTFKQQELKVKNQSAKIDEQRTQLKQEVDLLKNEDYVAKLARSRLYGSKNNEQIYTIPELNGTTELPDKGNSSQTKDNHQSKSSSSEKAKNSGE